MYFKFACPQCEKNLKVGEEKIGQKARCPYCHATVVVPAPETPQVPAAGEGPDTSFDIPVAAPRRKGEPAAVGAGAGTAAAAATTATGSGTLGASEASANASAEGTNVGMLWTGATALTLTAIWYGVLYPFPESRLWDLFYDRGWITFTEAVLFFWCISILIFKVAKLRRQKESMLFDLLPNEIGEDITVRNANQFVNHVRELPAKPGESFLINRVRRGLEHFQIRRSTPEVGTMLASQSDIDANAVESSYTLLKVFIWAIPILGFIGTVQGLGGAVAGFAGGMDNANDVNALKDSLSSIIGGLATAFDTTLVALIMSVPLTYLASTMQKSEEDLLNWVDEYTNENLLKRLNDGGGAGPANIDNRQALRAAIDTAFADYHAELEAWREKLESIGGKITEEVSGGWSGMLKELKTAQEELSKGQEEQIAERKQTAEQLGNAISGLASRADTVQEETVKAMRETASSVQTYFNGLEEAVESLNRVLGQLGEKQVVIQTQPRRWWFLGRSKNNGSD